MEEPAVAAPTTVREDLGRGGSKPNRKTSSFEREGWWRITLTNTPIPGTYHLKTFLEESQLNPVRATYGFKNEGRKKPPLVQRNNPVPTDLPQYMPPELLDLLKKQMTTYSFKDKPRPSPSTLVYKDQREGPGPGHYNVKIPSASSVTSSFQSRVPRFLPTSSKTPGPGAYTSSAQFPKQPRTIDKMGREHTLFFNNTIGV
ncbi:sperm-tail PG-rich repeat containing 4 [Rhinolophus ferrumequinum]|uniref:Sperm-tail PG-rich repeat containing 4 n=1 Tax=Rhinolophus ferrumequinum TaxID=59479 RepID=A0A7J7V9H3_RHIFE|nr:sperm-tail PG-rich repeat containing 4 [Rhinolophus ferrumequinum]